MIRAGGGGTGGAYGRGGFGGTGGGEGGEGGGDGGMGGEGGEGGGEGGGGDGEGGGGEGGGEGGGGGGGGLQYRRRCMLIRQYKRKLHGVAHELIPKRERRLLHAATKAYRLMDDKDEYRQVSCTNMNEDKQMQNNRKGCTCRYQVE